MKASEEAVFVVKDENAADDLVRELGAQSRDSLEIFTVKEAKGLEFKEIYVLERDMTENEKYIAYTRALVKLNVIEKLPHIVDVSRILYVQGNDNEEVQA